MLTIHLAGLMYFDACGDKAPRVLLPNGTQTFAGIEPHYASIWIEAERYESDTWWPNQKLAHAAPVQDTTAENKVFVFEFRIPEPVTVTFPDGIQTTFDNSAMEGKLPKLQSLGFELSNTPEAIAEFSLRGGVIAPFNLVTSSVVAWRIDDHDDKVTISAKTATEERTITLRSVAEVMKNPTAALNDLGVEIVFSNTPELLPANGTAGHAGHGGHGGHGPGGPTGMPHHFTLYAKLDKDQRTALFAHPVIPSQTTDLSFNHGLLRSLVFTNHTPGDQCGQGCC